MTITAFDLAQRFIGVTETAGTMSTPMVLAFLRLDNPTVADDATAWCSAFVNFIAWLLRLPRSKSLAARSWLTVGTPVALSEALAGFDVVILSRGPAVQPGPTIIDAPGHVGFFASCIGGTVYLLSGNDGDQVRIAGFPVERVLGVRRLA